MISCVALETSRILWFVIAVKSSKLATMKRLLSLLLLFVSADVLAESGSYQVEVIVFRNLLATNESSQVAELRSFSQFPNLEHARQTDTLPLKSAAESGETLAGKISGIWNGHLPDDFRIVTQKSDAMDNAWRRLRSSQNYRPLVYAAWQQDRIEYNPPIRIHDQQLIATRLNPPTRIMIADLTAQDPLAAYRSDLYQLDGSLQLRRSRFLHVDLDLELRDASLQPADDAGLPDASAFQIDMQDTTGETETYGVYALRQNRQVTTNKMQYFDTPYLGALVYVTNIQTN